LLGDVSGIDSVARVQRICAHADAVMKKLIARSL
jgi:hypothetical protein